MTKEENLGQVGPFGSALTRALPALVIGEQSESAFHLSYCEAAAPVCSPPQSSVLVLRLSPCMSKRSSSNLLSDSFWSPFWDSNKPLGLFKYLVLSSQRKRKPPIISLLYVSEHLGFLDEGKEGEKGWKNRSQRGNNCLRMLRQHIPVVRENGDPK